MLLTNGSRCMLLLQAPELYACSSAALVSQDGTRHSSFGLLRSSAGTLAPDAAPATASAALLSGWQAKPIGRAAATAPARAATAAEADKTVREQHAALSAAAWVYETQWQAAAALSAESGQGRQLSGSSCGSLSWQLQSAGHARGSGGGRQAAGVVSSRASLSTCLGLLRVLQLPAASSTQLLVRCTAGSNGSLRPCSSSSTVDGGGSAAATLAAAMLRTAALERPGLQMHLQLSDPASIQSQPWDAAGSTTATERLHCTSAAFVPRW